MEQLLNLRIDSGSWTPMLALLADAGTKGLVLMGLACLAVLALRRTSAAARHLVWMLALSGLVVLPLVSLVAPQWQLAILPARTEDPAIPLAAPKPSPIPVASAPAIEVHEEVPIPAAPPIPSNPPPDGPVTTEPVVESAAAPIPKPAHAFSPGTLLVALWLAIAAAALLPLFLGHVALLRKCRSARPIVHDDLLGLNGTLACALQLKRPAKLLSAGRGAMPMAAGLLRPAVFLPDEAETWPEPRQRAVLLHELAHVKRLDCATHALAHVAVSLHWFNPFAWYALRQLRVEREHACDDLVLAAGERPADYAENLLQIARDFRAERLTGAAAITMAKRSHLEGRLLAVLDAARNRKQLTPRVSMALMVSVAVVLFSLTPVRLTRADGNGKSISPQGELFDATYRHGLRATLTAVAEPGGAIWNPKGTYISPGRKDWHEEAIGDYPPEVDEISRLLFVSVTPVELSLDVGTKWRLNGKTGATLPTRGDENMRLLIHANIPSSDKTGTLELGLAAGAWSAIASGPPRYISSGMEFGIAFSALLKEDERTHVIVTHSKIEDEFRLVGVGEDGTQHPARLDVSAWVAGMYQSDFVFSSDVEASQISQLEFQVRPFEWKTISGIAIHPEGRSPIREQMKHLRVQFRLVAPEGEHDDATEVPWHEAANPVTDGPALWVLEHPYLSQDDIATVEVRRGHVETDYALAITLTEEGADALAKVTEENVGRKLAVVADGKVVFAPRISAPITHGAVMITGSLDAAQADALATVIGGDSAELLSADSPYAATLVEPAGMSEAAIEKGQPAILTAPVSSSDGSVQLTELNFVQEDSQRWTLRFNVINRTASVQFVGAEIYAAMNEFRGGVSHHATIFPLEPNFQGEISETFTFPADPIPGLKRAIDIHLTLAKTVNDQYYVEHGLQFLPPDAETLLETTLALRKGLVSLRDSSESDPQFGIPSPDVVWGDAVNGLQAALVLGTGDGTCELGKLIHVQVLVRNISSSTISFSNTGHLWPTDILVRDAAGNLLQGGEIEPHHVSLGYNQYNLSPGDAAIFYHPDILFISQPEGKPHAGTQATLSAAPGRYTIQIKTEIPGFPHGTLLQKRSSDTPVEIVMIKPGDWSGTLTTGLLNLEIVGALTPDALDATAVPSSA